MDDSLITILLTILVTLIWIVSQVRKKSTDTKGRQPAPQRDVLSDPFPTQIPDDPREVIRKFFGDLPEPAPSEGENAEPYSSEGDFHPEWKEEGQQVKDDLQEPEEIRKEKEALLSSEGIPATITYASAAEKEAYSDSSVSISSNEITDETGHRAREALAAHSILDDIDWRKAVIYSEILKRKDNF